MFSILVQKQPTEVLCKKGCFEKFWKIHRKTPEACNLIKKETQAQVFSCKFSKISQTTFSYRAPMVAASICCFLLFDTNKNYLKKIYFVHCKSFLWGFSVDLERINVLWYSKDFLSIITLQTHHVDSTLKQRGNGRFHVVSTWNPHHH